MERRSSYVLLAARTTGATMRWWRNCKKPDDCIRLSAAKEIVQSMYQAVGDKETCTIFFGAEVPCDLAKAVVNEAMLSLGSKIELGKHGGFVGVIEVSDE